ncbi:heavy metal translocating P-type ATPase [Hyphomicrobium sp. CS1GBMeth3]|uniref:heavy metal translocating P-type ATPase n=1 Tax=Hyphomicrobium sp. CS1GBMeth3 TaxID=1892845 RepID=UPI0009316EF0|nr:heavy metal translocating P-type ATPase [Hyphomicrobium sp. CS1GBMeth3]
MVDERFVRRSLLLAVLLGLLAGAMAFAFGHDRLADWLWRGATVPVVIVLAISIIRSLLARRLGVDAIALLAMAGAIALNQSLAAIVIAIMYTGGTVLEDYAVARAERNLKALIDRAPTIALRRHGGVTEQVPISSIAIGNTIVVRAGEIVPVDGLIRSPTAVIDESALTGEPIPVTRALGESARSGTLNAGDTFEMTAVATAEDSTYAGIVRLVTAAQTAKAPFIRLADRYALLLLPVSLLVAGLAWAISGEAVRALAVLVVATPCPLILAAPVAFIAGVSQAAHRGIIIKGGAPLDALAQTHTVLFDKTGTLTVGGARLVAIETGPGESADEVLRLAASLEQASQHVVADAIVAAAVAKGLALRMPSQVHEVMGSGLEGIVEGKCVRAGSHQLIFGTHRPDDWAQRALRRASWRSALSVFVSIDGRIAGALLLGDELRKETPRAVQSLRAAGITRIVMVSGDRADAAETIAAALDIDAVLSDRDPSDKVDAVAMESRLHPTLMVGDGINDAPALAAADVGVALGARGAGASSEAADVVIIVDRLDRVSEAVSIARRSRRIAVQSIVVGMGLSGIAMAAAAVGWLEPVAGALTQEAIDVAVIVNALRALRPQWRAAKGAVLGKMARELGEQHRLLEEDLDKLLQISDDLDDAEGQKAVDLILRAHRLVEDSVVTHERDDETIIYPRLTKYLADGHGLSAMSRAHREILHQARLLARIASELRAEDADKYLVRDAQRVIGSIEALVRIHNAQEDDIYEHVVQA